MKYYTFKKFTKKSGHLVPISFKEDVPFKPKRIFLIYGKKNFLRGDHAHKKCCQLFFPIKGIVDLIFTEKDKKKTIRLNPKNNNAVLIYNLVWCKLKFLRHNSIVMVGCDRKYEFKDYIEEYDDFLKIIKKK